MRKVAADSRAHLRRRGTEASKGPVHRTQSPQCQTPGWHSICRGTRQGRAFFKNTIPPSREHISPYIFSQSKKNAGYHYANPETWPACWVHWSRLVLFFWKMVFTNLRWLLWGLKEKTNYMFSTTSSVYKTINKSCYYKQEILQLKSI